MVGLGDLAGGGFGSEATAASADGSQVVGKGTSAAGTEAFLWNSASGMVGLGDLAGGSLSSEASSVSADGATVVGASSSASGSEAFRWRASTGMVGLGDLAGGNFSSRARAVSSNGSVVVGQGESASGQEAFLWTPQGGMQRLAAVLTSHGANLNGWVLRDATGISANGRSIVGYGVNPSGEIEAWVAVLPAAAPAVPLGPGVAVWTTLFVAAIGALRLRARG
jgi:probable HAF family extracellular repeat protein